ncbi:MAG: PepSY domain-containing protein [Acidimicrobiales bacterium]
MSRQRKTRSVIAVGALAVGLAGLAAARAGASGGDDAERPITGPALEQASAAALAHTGGGRVTDTEAGDEESAYEVEVTLDNGVEVDVQLDESFRVVDAPDTDGPEDGDEAD